MCGIWASIGFENLSRQVVDSVEHRGPDGRGWNEFSSERGPVVLGHRRLSIIDLSDNAHQPFSSEDGRYWLTYNGEIYNYVELKEELESLGWKFRTTSDTEVLLKSYQHWGVDCLHKFNGMFAFVVWDNQEEKFFIARDRFGVKPLYYYQSEDKFAFCSEIKQLTHLEAFRSKLNYKVAYDYFFHSLMHHSQETLFQGVCRLKGGEYAVLGKELLVRSWYDISGSKERFKGSFSDAREAVKSQFLDSVSLRMRSDVNVGACLSGGVDSSAIVSSFSHLLEDTNHLGTFSACYKNSTLDESRYIDVVSSHTQIKNHKVYPSAEGLMAQLQNIVYHHDHPIGGSTAFAQNEVFRLSNAHGVKVILDGQGADEIFAGYHSMFGAFHNELLMKGRMLRLYKELSSARSKHGYHLKTLIVRILESGHPALMGAFLRWVGKETLLCPAYMNESFFSDHNPRKELPWAQVLDAYGYDKTATLRDMSCQQIKMSLPTLLHCEDSNSMAHSVESRVPFLDYRLVELALSLPAQFKIRHSRTKHVFRESMRGIMPDTIVNRVDKLGFAVPEVEWFKQESIREAALPIIKETIASFSGIFDQRYLGALDTDNVNSQFYDGWNILDFGIWADQFGVKG